MKNFSNLSFTFLKRKNPGRQYTMKPLYNSFCHRDLRRRRNVSACCVGEDLVVSWQRGHSGNKF